MSTAVEPSEYILTGEIAEPSSTQINDCPLGGA